MSSESKFKTDTRNPKSYGVYIENHALPQTQGRHCLPDIASHPNHEILNALKIMP